MTERDRTFPPRVVRFSELKSMARSAAHFRAAYEHPIEPSAAMRFGTLVHTLILGGERFAVFEGKRRSGKAWEAFEEEHADALIVTLPEYERGVQIATKVHAHAFAGPLLVGKREHELRWMYAGRTCGGRLDVLGETFVTDVKTGTNAQPDWFTRHALRMAWHAQGEWYRFGAVENGYAIHTVNIIAVEIKQPFAITVFQLTTKALEAGAKLCRAWIERLNVCEGAQAGGDWPEYADFIVPLDVPDELELNYGEEPVDEAA